MPAAVTGNVQKALVCPLFWKTYPFNVKSLKQTCKAGEPVGKRIVMLELAQS